MRLSYTALRTFQQCHFRYHLRYDRGLAGRPRPTAQSSRALHGALHLLHQDLKSQQAALAPSGSDTSFLAGFGGVVTEQPISHKMQVSLHGQLELAA